MLKNLERNLKTMVKMFSNNCCASCKFLRKLKHNFSVEEGYQKSYVCVAFEYCDTELGKDLRNNFMLEVDSTDMCEMYSKAYEN